MFADLGTNPFWSRFLAYLAAQRVLNHTASVSDVAVASATGLVTWDVDCDVTGYYPAPTAAYLRCMDKYAAWEAIQ